MKLYISIDRLAHWTATIRNNPESRILDAVKDNQLFSKAWLVETLTELIDKPSAVTIMGGWYGVLASMFHEMWCNTKFINVELDLDCMDISHQLNKGINYEFVWDDMVAHKVTTPVVINTSCEHITQEDFDDWFNDIPDGTVVALQSNNMFDTEEEHVNCMESLDQFRDSVSFSETLFVGEHHIREDIYRYMIIGIK